jgi:hypothetical protein
MNDGADPTERMLTYLQGQGGNGATMEEIEDALGMAHTEAAAALAMLLTRGLADASGAMRSNRQNRPTNVYIATEG